MRLDLTRLPVNAARRLSPRRLRQILGPCERVVGGLERERSGEDYCHVRRSSTISSAPICKGELINARWPSRRRSPAPSASAAAFVDGCGETPSGKCVFDRSELDTRDQIKAPFWTETRHCQSSAGTPPRGRAIRLSAAPNQAPPPPAPRASCCTL